MSASDGGKRSGSRLAPLAETWRNWTALLAGGATDLVLLAARLWLAQLFFVSGVLKTATWDATVFLYTDEHPIPGVDPVLAALIGTGAELICPLLLVVGLGTRLAALPLVATALFLQLTYRPLPDHLYWIGLLSVLIAGGAGALSVDRLLAPHLVGSALPFGRVLRAAGDRLSRVALPPVLLAVRLGVAWLLVEATLRAAAPLVIPWALTACALLAAGVASRASALALAIATPVLLTDAGAGEPLPRLLLLAVVVCRGGGPLSLDALAWRFVRRRCPTLADDFEPTADAPRIVVVGAGFGGIAAARGLRHADARVTLIDRRNYHLFQPLLYQVATASLSPADIAVPIRTLLRGQRNCRVLMGRVVAVDLPRREVVLENADRIGFDRLVVATGARHSYFGKDAWEPFAPGLKKIDDATAMRSRILAAFERAEACDDPAERTRLLTFVVVGAGPTGVELAGAIAELARQSLREEFRVADPTSARIVLVQSGPRILPALPERLSAAALASLTELGVEVLTETRVTVVDAAGVVAGNRRLESRTVLWAAGVTASAAGRWLGAERDAAGRVVVATDLTVPGLPGVYAIGDTAACAGVDGRPLPGLAATAKQQGSYVARHIRAELEGRPTTAPFRYRDWGSMATIGRRAAVADLPGLRLTGSPAWWLWGLVHVAFLVDLRSRIAVMFDWFWSYLTYNRSMRLITGAEAHPD